MSNQNIIDEFYNYWRDQFIKEGRVNISATKELDNSNIQKQYDEIQQYHDKFGKYKSKFQEAQYNIFKYIITSVLNDPEHGDYCCTENEKLIKDAGKLLYEFDGINGMKNQVIWSCIPNRYQREIDMMWHGIGGWKS